jgi:hypothetical protein
LRLTAFTASGDGVIIAVRLSEMPQPEKRAADASGSGMPYETALLQVIKGLHRDPILLFGIGAGILLVAVLAVTTSLAVVLVVAGLFVVVLAARAHQRAQRVTRGEDIRARVVGSSIEESDVATAPAGFWTRIRTGIFFSKVSGSRVGSVGDRPPSKPPED